MKTLPSTILQKAKLKTTTPVTSNWKNRLSWKPTNPARVDAALNLRDCVKKPNESYSAMLEAVPRALGWLGAVAVLMSAGAWLPRVDENLYPVFALLAIPYMLWQLGLGIWLLLRGTKEAEEPTGVSH